MLRVLLMIAMLSGCAASAQTLSNQEQDDLAESIDIAFFDGAYSARAMLYRCRRGSDQDCAVLNYIVRLVADCSNRYESTVNRHHCVVTTYNEALRRAKGQAL